LPPPINKPDGLLSVNLSFATDNRISAPGTAVEAIGKAITVRSMLHPKDAAALGVADGDKIVLGNRHGEVRLHARLFEGVRRGVVIAESIWPNHAYEDGRGINTLTGADAIAPFGGAAFHDKKVWIRRAM
jgi:anaerobic selenocysteine-containing dehydrogenase